MNKFILTLTLACAAHVAQAQQDTLRLGYCNGEVGTNPRLYTRGAAWTDCAIRLHASELAAYRGCQITGVKAALAARNNTDTLSVWVRETVDGADLARATVVRQGLSGVYNGWNTLLFDQPFTIPADCSTLYVGYSLHQKAPVMAVATTSREVEGSSMVKLGAEDWKDISQKGTLCIEALVSGETLPDADLGMADARIEPVSADGSTLMQATMRVHNFGCKAVQGFTVEASADGVNPVVTRVEKAVASQADSTLTFRFDPAVSTTDATPWRLRLTETDACAANNEVAANYRLTRNLMIEEFTTEKCTNCPNMAGYLRTVLAEPRNAGRINVVAHHIGYQTDWLTLGNDEDYLWIYNGAAFAPAVTLDRHPMFTVINSNNVPTATGGAGSAEELSGYVAQVINQPTEAKLSLSLVPNEDYSQLNVEVDGLCTSAYNTPHPHLSVFLVESDIAPVNQSGAAGTSYMHQHVVRAMNATWGEPVEWKDGRMQYATTFALNKDWKRDNMEVVAFVGNYDSTSPLACITDNSVKAALPSAYASAIHPVTASAEIHETARYDLSGRRVDASTRGVVIVRMSDGTWHKTVVAR